MMISKDLINNKRKNELGFDYKKVTKKKLAWQTLKTLKKDKDGVLTHDNNVSAYHITWFWCTNVEQA